MFLIPSATALVASLALTSPSVVGPAWISIEFPVNPYDRATRGAFLLVHAFHHGRAQDLQVSGSAEGVVDGVRRSVSLRFRSTNRDGVYALANQWGTQGEWTLILTVADTPTNRAQAMVRVSGANVIGVSVATRPGRDGNRPMTMPRDFTREEIEASLRRRGS